MIPSLSFAHQALSLSFQISFCTKRVCTKREEMAGPMDGGQIKYKMSLEHLFVLGKRGEFRECWGCISEKQINSKGLALATSGTT